MWVRTTSAEGDMLTGRLLNQPKQLQTISLGSQIQFIVPATGAHPLRVSAKYVQERADWKIEPCTKCGLSELFDAPSDLVRVVFPSSTQTLMMTVLCGACGGIQSAKRISQQPQ